MFTGRTPEAMFSNAAAEMFFFTRVYRKQQRQQQQQHFYSDNRIFQNPHTYKHVVEVIPLCCIVLNIFNLMLICSWCKSRVAAVKRLPVLHHSADYILIF